ncbi:MAG: helix-hairpin-helix domain-containing protein [Acidimicrobiia bacterium]|nr:helix-hairpin-helix domain-containing protein [Acidimicrobiia bacterium]
MKRVTKVTGIVIGVGAAVAAVAWMLRDRIARPPRVAAPQPVPAFRVAPPAAPARSDADDLALIRGIGPVFKARLATAGISRFDELAAADAGRLAEVAGVPEGRAAEWIDQARSLV